MSQDNLFQRRAISVPLRLDHSPPQIDPNLVENKITQEEYNQFWYELKAVTASLERKEQILRVINLLILIGLTIFLIITVWKQTLSGYFVFGILILYLVTYGVFSYFWDRMIANQKAQFVRKQNQSVWNNRNLEWSIDRGVHPLRYPRLTQLVLAVIPDVNLTFNDASGNKIVFLARFL